MLTALDIQNKDFTKGIRGYNEEEVDVFLDEIIVDYQALIDKNTALEAKVAELEAKLLEYKSTDGAVLRTLESAKNLMYEISQSAEKRADILIRNAELEAASKIHQADEDVKTLTAERERLQVSVKSLKSRIKDLLTSEITRLDTFDEDMFK